MELESLTLSSHHLFLLTVFLVIQGQLLSDIYPFPVDWLFFSVHHRFLIFLYSSRVQDSTLLFLSLITSVNLQVFWPFWKVFLGTICSCHLSKSESQFLYYCCSDWEQSYSQYQFFYHEEEYWLAPRVLPFYGVESEYASLSETDKLTYCFCFSSFRFPLYELSFSIW